MNFISKLFYYYIYKSVFLKKIIKHLLKTLSDLSEFITPLKLNSFK